MVFKLVIFGDGGVGKTTLTQRYVEGVFNEGTSMTIGSDFHIKKLEVDGKRVLLQIWDFAGERQFRFLLPTYVRGASGGIFMYDITRFSSLKNVNEWMNALTSEQDDLLKIPIICVGGKADLENKRAVTQSMAEMIADEQKFIAHVECSAKTGDRVEKVFENITMEMMKKANLD
jgi:small GTP-binding protein